MLQCLYYFLMTCRVKLNIRNCHEIEKNFEDISLRHLLKRNEEV